MADTTTVYPKPGVTVYLPGGVHGFAGEQAAAGVPLPAAHAADLVKAGHLDTEETRKAAADLAAAKAQERAAQAAEAQAAHAAAAQATAAPAA